MEISSILEVERGVTALIGGGGKTTLLYTLAKELRRQGTVIVTTSTHIRPPTQYPTLLCADSAAVVVALREHGAICVAAPGKAEGKLTAPNMELDTLASLADFVLVEADGAKGLPLKAHAPHEPVIPSCTKKTIYVLGADGFGHPIHEVCHRPERYAALCGASPAAPVTPAMAARVLLAEGYGAGCSYVNKVESSKDWDSAAAFAACLSGRVAAGSLHRREYRLL